LVKGISSRNGLWLAGMLVALYALLPGYATAGGAMPNHQQMVALYVIDHDGTTPTSVADLVAYSQPFERILGGCRIGVDDLTNRVLDLVQWADYDSDSNDITSLAMLHAIASRIIWSASTPHGCGYIYDLAEAQLGTIGP
jgi:hypothetical protein